MLTLEWEEFDDPVNGACTPNARRVHGAAVPNGTWAARLIAWSASGREDAMAAGQAAVEAALRQMVAEAAGELGGVVTWPDDETGGWDVDS